MAGPKWKRFEQLVAAIHHAETQGAVVRWNDLINGRQFDVTVRFKHGLHEYLTVVECKDEGRKVSAEEVDAFVTKARDANANKAVIVSSRGFQSGCMPIAERHGVKLLILSETAAPQVASLVEQVVPMFYIHTVSLECVDGGKEFRLEDRGGKLEYLILHTFILWRGGKFTLADAIDNWLAQPQGQSSDSQEVRAAFPGGAQAAVPHEEPFAVTAVKFKVALINGFVADGPIVDRHLLHSLTTKVELRTVDGKVEFETRLSDVPFGFDTKLEAGRFYAAPTLHMNYYCEAIDGETVHLSLIESYQHGNLVRARLTANVKKAKGYVEITDKREIERLRKLLDEYNALKERDETRTG